MAYQNMHKINKALDNGKVSLCLLLELSKAFDTVDHHLLLEDIDVGGPPLALFLS